MAGDEAATGDDPGAGDAHSRELRDLGFPEAVIDEVRRARALGLFERQPTPAMILRTIEECRALVAKPVLRSPRDGGE